MTIPEQIQLTATANRHMYGTGYSLVVRDQEGRSLGSCSSSPCPVNGNGSFWADNANPQPRTFNAELRGPGGAVVATSNYVTVNVQKFMWNVSSVVASPQTQLVPGSVAFNATVDRSVYGTGYQIYMYRDGASSTNERCSSGTQCVTSVSRTWPDNPSPRTARVRVEVRGPGGDLASNVVEAEGFFRRFIFPVDLTFTTATDASNNLVHNATATTNRNVYGTGYQLKIERDDGTVVCSASSGSTPNNTQCGPTTVAVGRTYRAVVANGTHVAAQSHAFTLTAGGPVVAGIGEADLAALAAAIGASGGIYDICTRIGLSPVKTNIVEPHTSGGDQWEACVFASGLAGVTTLDILRAIADTPAGEANLLWLTGDASKPVQDDPETPTSSDDSKAPRRLPRPFLPAAEKLADVLVANNDLPSEVADAVSEQCIFLHWRAGAKPSRCSSLPIFASGSDVAAATNHDLEALDWHEPWVLLAYRHQDLTPGDRNWMNAEDECEGRVAGVWACDEYPFWATMQGGPESVPLPHLDLIDFLDNRDQGLRYGNFVQSCHMNTGDPAFLGVPLPPELGIKTQTKICNGH